MIFPQLPLKGEKNDLVSVPETLKRKRPPVFALVKPGNFSVVAFVPDFVARLIF